MDRRQLPIMANQFQSVFDPATRHDQGDQLEFCQRQRLITPLRFGLSVVASMAAQQVQSLADVPRGFHAFWGLEVRDNAFDHQRAQPRCREFLRTSLCDIIGQLTLKVLGVHEGAAWSACDQMVMQDGSACAIHDARRQVCPGRFSAVQPAAVALPCTMDVLHEAPIPIVLSPDTDSEHVALPAPASLKGRWFRADRGSRKLPSLSDVAHQGGCLVVRAKEALHPLVIAA